LVCIQLTIFGLVLINFNVEKIPTKYTEHTDLVEAVQINSVLGIKAMQRPVCSLLQIITANLKNKLESNPHTIRSLQKGYLDKIVGVEGSKHGKTEDVKLLLSFPTD
jgi:hypothetical protein